MSRQWLDKKKEEDDILYIFLYVESKSIIRIAPIYQVPDIIKWLRMTIFPLLD